MSTRMAPHYCPYCSDQDLRPHAGAEARAASGWECRGCLRIFSVAFIGIAGVPA
jgi:transposase-like protein